MRKQTKQLLYRTQLLVYEGKPYERMHINRFKRIIKENGGN